MDFTLDFLKLGLDGASKRHRALADNIANVDTPNYKRKDVDFVSTLKSIASQNAKLKLETTDDGHISGTGSVLKPFKEYRITNTSYRNDGNNVDIEVEMAELAKNNLYYNTLVQQISQKFKILNETIDKGSR
ncbi:flagellar basal body rod protein FlgB [Halothermothrix orenii]|uniref:Flagellar basal body rod protein FlgB n=1 Tax=Halothermothrix orenii (strain H 168 / OCM 544 / DSM 9562) TaxID=373903 RepID=B8CYS2_HALOH|nr:flagellar basal body rod protein FlgB [Halothermothrix orenii]ACL70441.1 flagellar basal-body rod protein FlgB [Halothermothrix orenii H 168]